MVWYPLVFWSQNRSPCSGWTCDYHTRRLHHTVALPLDTDPILVSSSKDTKKKNEQLHDKAMECNRTLTSWRPHPEIILQVHSSRQFHSVPTQPAEEVVNRLKNRLLDSRRSCICTGISRRRKYRGFTERTYEFKTREAAEHRQKSLLGPLIARALGR